MPQAVEENETGFTGGEWCNESCTEKCNVLGIKNLDDWRWVAVTVFFLAWGGVYCAIFGYAVTLMSSLNVLNVISCSLAVGTNCQDSACTAVGTTMLIFGICGSIFFLNLAVLSFSLWTSKTLKSQIVSDDERHVHIRSRRGGVDNTANELDIDEEKTAQQLPPLERVRETQRSLSAIREESSNSGREEVRDDFLAIEMAPTSNMREENIGEKLVDTVNSNGREMQREEDSFSTAPKRVSRKPEDHGEDGYVVHPFACLSPFCVKIQCLFSKCPDFYMNPAECVLRCGKESWCDSFCFINWSTVGAQLCMFPWFILVITCTITVVGKTDPYDFGLQAGVCSINNVTNSTSTSSYRLEKAGVQLTWFAIIFTWITIGSLGILGMILTATTKMKRRKSGH